MIVVVSPMSDEAAELISELDSEIGARYPGSPINGIDAAGFEKAGGYFLIAREAGQPVGCGAFRPVGDRCAEIKRMFVRKTAAPRGPPRKIPGNLETEIPPRGLNPIGLETGESQGE